MRNPALGRLYKTIKVQFFVHVEVFIGAFMTRSSHFQSDEPSSCHFREFFFVPVSPHVRFEGGEIAFFFDRAIFDQFWSSTAPALCFLAVLRFFGARPPDHFGDLELTGTKNKRMITRCLT